MTECLISQARSNLGKAGDIPGHGTDHGRVMAIVRTPLDKIEDMDRSSGQIICHCSVDGCNAELEVFPDPATPGIYDVSSDSLSVARFICQLSKEG